MSELGSQRSTAERVLDLAVYVPLGVALSLAEAMPAMARKGRTRLAPQVGLARTVGQLAVHQGYRQLRDMASGGAVVRFGRPTPTVSTPTRGEPGPLEARFSPAAAASGLSPTSVSAPVVPLASELAIPSYDSLSAPQVVHRLAGLSHDEVVAVRDYEAGTRRRKTILTRAEQLLA
jgi:hypothetical protein